MMRKLDLTTNPQPTVATNNSTVTSSDNVVPTSNLDGQNVSNLQSTDMKKTLKKLLPLLLIVVIAGVSTGFGVHKLTAKDTGVPADGKLQQVAGDDIKNDDVFGSADEKAFQDTAVGYLQEGGLDGEGSHHLLRPGGEAQTVYLTSSVTDLDKLVGMEVQIWGETFKGQKAGWLMDVGRVKVINVEGESPLEE
jgi:hypothetical protein